MPEPAWHAPWELSAVISGHLGWVRSIAFDASNEWFVTGSADRTIKASALVPLTPVAPDDDVGVGPGQVLRGRRGRTQAHAHRTHQRDPRTGGVSSSPLHVLRRRGQDGQVYGPNGNSSRNHSALGWDLEYNKVIRHYHGHLSGVYCLSLHPTLDVLVTGGRGEDFICQTYA